MPYPFTLPTTSYFDFSCFSCESHPSLPFVCSLRRMMVREELKKIKRLPLAYRPAHVSSLVASVGRYLGYVFALDAGLHGRWLHGGQVGITVSAVATPVVEWRPTLSGNVMHVRKQGLVKIQSLEYELMFALATLGYGRSLLAHDALWALHRDRASDGSPSTQERATAIATATKHLLDAASVHDYMARRAEAHVTVPPYVDIAAPTARALSLLALAEATLLAVLKDDPYPVVVARERDDKDREWMYKAPDIPKVRAHLFGRLCLAAADHAGQAAALCRSGVKGTTKIDDDVVAYMTSLRRTCRARACRFFAIDAELSGQTGNALGWLRCGLEGLGAVGKKSGRGPSLSSMRKEWSSKREQRKIEQGWRWGLDAGMLEETRVMWMLWDKWSKVNDTMLAQAVPPPATLLSTLPSGREIHIIKPYLVPELDRQSLERLRDQPDRPDDDGGDTPSSDDEAHAFAASPEVPSSGTAGTGPSYF